MTVIRKFAVQGHAIPSMAHSPRGPFRPEVLEQPRRVDDEHHSDSLHAALDDIRFFKCKECQEVLLEDELGEHVCEEPDDV